MVPCRPAPSTVAPAASGAIRGALLRRFRRWRAASSAARRAGRGAAIRQCHGRAGSAPADTSSSSPTPRDTPERRRRRHLPARRPAGRSAETAGRCCSDGGAQKWFGDAGAMKHGDNDSGIHGMKCSMVWCPADSAEAGAFRTDWQRSFCGNFQVVATLICPAWRGDDRYRWRWGSHGGQRPPGSRTAPWRPGAGAGAARRAREKAIRVAAGGGAVVRRPLRRVMSPDHRSRLADGPNGRGNEK